MSNALIKEIRSELENAPDSYHKDLLEKKIKQLELAVQESYQNKVGKVIGYSQILTSIAGSDLSVIR